MKFLYIIVFFAIHYYFHCLMYVKTHPYKTQESVMIGLI
jgi:hypothetical protein